MARHLFLFLSLAAGSLAHEHHGTSLYPRAEAIPPPSFGYHGMEGAVNWYNLNKDANELCAKGTHQSPIDLSSTFYVSSTNSSLSIPAAPQGAEFLNLGTTVEVITNGTLVHKGKTSKLAQFHFHSPSEHSIDGVYYPLEVHFVFQADDASLSVVGFLFDIGKKSDEPFRTVAAALPDIPSHGNTTITDALSFKAIERHFAQHKTYQYSGSLTTPPCSEGVSWTVSAAPLTVDYAAFNAFKKALKFNSRFTQNNPEHVNLLENIANTLE